MDYSEYAIQRLADAAQDISIAIERVKKAQRETGRDYGEIVQSLEDLGNDLNAEIENIYEKMEE